MPSNNMLLNRKSQTQQFSETPVKRKLYKLKPMKRALAWMSKGYGDLGYGYNKCT